MQYIAYSTNQTTITNQSNIMDSLIIKGQTNLSTISSNNEDIFHLSLVSNTYSNNPTLDIGVIEKLEFRNIYNYRTTIHKPLLEKVVNNGEVILTNIITNKLDCSRFKKVTLNRCTILDIIRGECEIVMDDKSLNIREILTGEFITDGNTYNGHYYINNDNGTYIKNGYGIEIYSNGDKYEGEWRNNQRYGQGTMNYANGDKYEGGWLNNRRSGQGKFTYTNGDRYEGEWYNNRRYEQGTMTYANGDKYEGRWRYDAKTTVININ
jgi:hypothetical protein